MERENKTSTADNPYDVVDAIDELTKAVKIVAGSLAKIAVVQQAGMLYPDHAVRQSLIAKCRELMAAQVTVSLIYEDALSGNVGTDRHDQLKGHREDMESVARELNEFSLQHPVIIQLLAAEIVGKI